MQVQHSKTISKSQRNGKGGRTKGYSVHFCRVTKNDYRYIRKFLFRRTQTLQYDKIPRPEMMMSSKMLRYIIMLHAKYMELHDARVRSSRWSTWPVLSNGTKQLHGSLVSPLRSCDCESFPSNKEFCFCRMMNENNLLSTWENPFYFWTKTHLFFKYLNITCIKGELLQIVNVQFCAMCASTQLF